MAKVTMIPASINPLTQLPSITTQKRKVAGYARVSTDSDEQFTSYEAQVDYYTNYIKAKPEWEFVGLYSDEGISATNTKKRDGFNLMISDALSGKIDLIVTKSVSRFARNTVDSLTTIRKLKEHKVECYFEKESIFTFDGKGELLLTIMSSLAQEESRSISENVTWGQRKRFADGKVHMPYKRFLGYEKGEDGKPTVIEEEADIVRLIYRLFLEGKTVGGIGTYLENLGISSPGGSEKWGATTVQSILTNEKYKGDALLQKTFTVDFLQKKMKTNEGEVPQYYVESSHPPIIEPEEWNYVQMEMARRKALGRAYSGKSVLSTKLICVDCGNFYGSKVWHSTSKYRRTIWQCNHKFKNDEKCSTPKFNENEIKEKFLIAYNQLMAKKNNIIEDLKLMQKCLSDLTEIDEKIEKHQEEVLVITELVKNLIHENASTSLPQDEYLKKYDGLNQRYENATKILEGLQTEKQRRLEQDNVIALYIKTLKKNPTLLEEWDDTIWMVMVEKAVIHKDKRITFKFYNGAEITVGE